MQATVATYDGVTRSGSVLLDDGVRAEFAGAAVVDSIRHLRPGQRVIIITTEGEPAPTITSVRIH